MPYFIAPLLCKFLCKMAAFQILAILPRVGGRLREAVVLESISHISIHVPLGRAESRPFKTRRNAVWQQSVRRGSQVRPPTTGDGGNSILLRSASLSHLPFPHGSEMATPASSAPPLSPFTCTAKTPPRRWRGGESKKSRKKQPVETDCTKMVETEGLEPTTFRM